MVILFLVLFSDQFLYNVHWQSGIKSEGIQHYYEATKLYGRKERYHGRSAVPSQ